jgi:hypothetical protein
MEVTGQLHTTTALPPGIHWIGDWVGPRAGMDAMEKRKLLHCQDSNPGSPARSLPLY